MIKRLFISTGFYSSLLASALVDDSTQSYYENHLLITLDRQSPEHNKLWAYRLFANWSSVNTIDHNDYYVGSIRFNHPIEFFDEVISPFPEMEYAVSQAFRARKYSYYEEGLTSYRQFLDGTHQNDDFFFCLHPYLFKDNYNFFSLPISKRKVVQKIELVSQCYQTPDLSGDNNVVLIGNGSFPEEEKNIAMRQEYLRVISDLSMKGYNIILLDHTRVPVDAELMNLLDNNLHYNVKKLTISSPLSDVFLNNNKANIKFIIGLYSTLLLNSKMLFGIDSYSMNVDFLSDRQINLAEIQNLVIPSYK
jgi:hypothetical protein